MMNDDLIKAPENARETEFLNAIKKLAAGLSSQRGSYAEFENALMKLLNSAFDDEGEISFFSDDDCLVILRTHIDLPKH